MIDKIRILNKNHLMKYKYSIFIVLLLLSFVSCLHSRSSVSTVTAKAEIKVIYGNAILNINGKITENLYLANIFTNQKKNIDYYDNPTINEGTITKNETINFSTGDKYTFFILPAEVVTINIISLDGNDVEIITYQFGEEKRYTIKGTDKLGLLIAFKNR